MIVIASLVPREGRSALQELPPPLGHLARAVARRRQVIRPFPRPLTAGVFGNGMTPDQLALLHGGCLPESLGPAREPVDRRGLPAEIPRTWVLATRDPTLRVRTQRRFMANLGGIDDLVEIDACHDVMISDPARLADVLLARVPA